MDSFKLSARAEADLIAIYDYSDKRFGAYQAEAYFSGLERTFELLADFPNMGIDVEYLAPRHRRLRFQSHYIFYTEEGDHIVIRALFHTSRNIRSPLFD